MNNAIKTKSNINSESFLYVKTFLILYHYIFMQVSRTYHNMYANIW